MSREFLGPDRADKSLPVAHLVDVFCELDQPLVLDRHLGQDHSELRERLVKDRLALFDVHHVVLDYADIGTELEEHP